MVAARASFGRRENNLGGSPRSRRTSRPATASRARNAVSQGPQQPILRVEAGLREIVYGIIGLAIAYAIFQAAEEGSLFMMAMAGLILAGGALMLLNTALGKASLVVDDRGFRSESLLGTRNMNWEDLESFQITTINFVTTINAKARKKSERGNSSTYVHIPNHVFKRKDLVFVEELLSRRPDMADATVSVMQRLRAKKLLKQLMGG